MQRGPAEAVLRLAVRTTRKEEADNVDVAVAACVVEGCFTVLREVWGRRDQEGAQVRRGASPEENP